MSKAPPVPPAGNLMDLASPVDEKPPLEKTVLPLDLDFSLSVSISLSLSFFFSLLSLSLFSLSLDG